jgi:hypothetical protein
MTNAVKIWVRPQQIYIELMCINVLETPDSLDEILVEMGLNLDRTKPFPMDSSDRVYYFNKGTVEMVKKE